MLGSNDSAGRDLLLEPLIERTARTRNLILWIGGPQRADGRSGTGARDLQPRSRQRLGRVL